MDPTSTVDPTSTDSPTPDASTSTAGPTPAPAATSTVTVTTTPAGAPDAGYRSLALDQFTPIMIALGLVILLAAFGLARGSR